MFRLLVLIHLLAAASLTIYLTFFWERESLPDMDREARRICGKFSGCIPGEGTNSTQKELAIACQQYHVKRCSGVLRCCLDCQATGKGSKKKNPHPLDVFDFKDSHGSILITAGTGMGVHVIIYGILAILRKTRQDASQGPIKRKKKSKEKNEQCVEVRNVITGAILFVGLAFLTATTLYTVLYTVNWWPQLKECQTTFFAIISWDIVLLLSFVDYVLSFVPKIFLLLLCKKTKNWKLLEAVCDKIVNGVGGVLLVWWVLVLIYLEGVYRCRWKLNF